MRVVVDPELCIACGACISLAPEVFDWDDDGKAKAVEDDLDGSQADEALEGLESCPTEAIKKA